MNYLSNVEPSVRFLFFKNSLLKLSFFELVSTCLNKEKYISKIKDVDADLRVAWRDWPLWPHKKKEISTNVSSNVLYKEMTASGRSHKNWYSKLGGAKDCLCLEVTKNELWVTPTFPFPDLVEILDIDHKINTESIIDITENTLAFKKSFLIKYSDSNGAIHVLEVVPKKPKKFRNALNK